ncbi:MAG: hypothetical protein FWE07_07170 [Turicibacter sp.]|nr:hypothetical protein [Turicibacter sp.]
MFKKVFGVIWALVVVTLVFLITAPYLFPEWRDWFPEDGRNHLEVIEAGQFESVVEAQEGTLVIFVGDGHSRLTVDFQENLEEAMQEHLEVQVYAFNATHPDVEALEFELVMEALEITALPALVQLRDFEVVGGHTHFDGAAVAELSGWLGTVE